MNFDDRRWKRHEELMRKINFEIGEAIDTTCISCRHFDAPTEGCRLANGQRPPAEVIAYGCDSHDWIPF